MGQDLNITDENLLVYIEESNDYLANIETDLLEIEKMGENIDKEIVNRVFRAAHTIKGGAGFFNLNNIKKLGHKAENILDLIRSGELIPTSEVINILLIAFDRLHELINDVSNSNDADISNMIESLNVLLKAEIQDPKEKKDLDEEVEVRDKSGNALFTLIAYDYDQIVKNGLFLYLIDIDFVKDLHLKGRTPIQLYREMKGTGTLEATNLNISSIGTLEDPSSTIPISLLFSTSIKPKKISKLFDIPNEQIYEIKEVYPVNPKNEVPEVEPDSIKTDVLESKIVETEIAGTIKNELLENSESTSSENVATEHSKGEVVNSIRVKVDLLEQLMVLAGELVLSRNELNEAISTQDEKRLSSSGQRISQVTSEIQEAIMLTRLQNIGSVFNKFPRIVRDMSKKLNKEIDLKIYGNEVELDKTIIEGLNDPLTHMIRNSVDHGIESNEERVRQGKKAKGVIELRAYHEAGQVIIEIIDDGKGIDPENIAKKAVASGILTGEEAQNLSVKDKINLIFSPGLSTAEEVTDVSGRGVGMDVVKSKLDELGGVIDIRTNKGKGSTFRIKLPLTLAIIPSLLVYINNERFAIPQVNIEELINIPHKDIANKVEKIGWIDVLDLRGDLIPLIMLDDVLGIDRTFIDRETGERLPERRKTLSDRRTAIKDEGIEESINIQLEHTERMGDRRINPQRDINIVIVSTGNNRYGFVVEELADNLEIVVKPIGRHLTKCKEYAGATIMGDGKVALILDVAGIANLLDIQSIRNSDVEETNEQESVDEEITSYLTFNSSRNEHCAIPMQLVTRVEHIEKEQLEYIGHRRFMQYRGKTLPVVALQDVADCNEIEDDLELSVIVTNVYDREFGLLAVRPVDSLNRELTIDEETLSQKGVLGSTLIDDKTTLIVDIFDIVESEIEDLASHHRAEEVDGKSPLILIVEDSSFFINQINNFVTESGYRTLLAEDGVEAWEKLDSSEELPALIITDIEMPRMNGYELTEKVRADNRFKDIPVLAVTTLAGESEMNKGLESGITQYHVKLDKKSLLDSIKEKVNLGAKV